MGAIIGSGWLFGSLYGAQIAGPAAILSWAIGGLMIMIIGIVYAELAVMFPVSGGIIRFPHEAMFIALIIGYLVFAVYSAANRHRMPPLNSGQAPGSRCGSSDTR